MARGSSPGGRGHRPVAGQQDRAAAHGRRGQGAWYLFPDRLNTQGPFNCSQE